MRCPKCGKENPEGAKFCMDCAAALVLVCALCGAELPPAARFCPNCAAPVGAVQARPEGPTELPCTDFDRAIQRLVPKEYAERLKATRGQAHDERRTVTILFSDVKGSTAMAAKLDPEDVKEIMCGVFEFLIPAVCRYEGTLTQLMGDAILAFFGAPIAHEDDPERACRAGLEIVAEAAKYAEKLERERGIQGFNVRVGINTGLVVVGELGSDLRVAYTAMGDAINLAARMEQNAPPGGILITEETYRLVQSVMEAEPQPPLAVKGKSEAMQTYLVVSARAVAGKQRGIPGLESPLVGRESELGALQEAIERLRAGVGGIVTVVGEAGIGKSRLVAEARRDVPAERLYWVEGRCLSYGSSIPYVLWLDMLRGLLRLEVDTGPEEVRGRLREWLGAVCAEGCDAVYPYLARLMAVPLDEDEEAGLRGLDGEMLKANTFGALKTLIECAAKERPLVLVCEDLQWSDPTSVELLQEALELTDRVSVLFVCLFRPQRASPCWRIREVAARDYPHRHSDIWLKPLGTDESQALVQNLLRTEEVPGPVRERILSAAEGNPLYVEEVLRGWIDQGAVIADEATGSWQVTAAAAEAELPPTLEGVLLARIDRLQEDTKRVLQMASVVGRVFLERVLAAIADEQRDLGKHLLTLQREEMIRERARIPELEYIFKHELTREAAYNGLLKKERRAFHRRVAEALERMFAGRLETQLGLLAYHWEAAGDAEKATLYLLRAGDQSRVAYAHREAVDYYRRALAFLKDQAEPELGARTLMKLGLTHQAALDFRDAREAFEEGFRLWQRGSEMAPGPLPPAPHALRMAWPHLETLDPAKAEMVRTQTLLSQLFPALVEETPELGVVPGVAYRWEVSEEGCRWTFHLRTDVLWSDAAPLTAADFEYTWKRMLHPETAAPMVGLLYAIRGARAFREGEVSHSDSVGVRATDECTLVIDLEEPTAYLLHLLAAGLAVPRHVVERHGDAWTEPQNIATSGPFRLESLQPGQSLVLTRYRAYYGNRKGNVERVELALRTPDELRAELAAYEADALDVLDIDYQASDQLHALRERHAGEYVSVPTLSVHFLVFDTSQPPFDDRRARQALAMAIDRESLCDLVLHGNVFPALGGLLPPGMPGHAPGIGWPYDPQRARELLAEAGYPGGTGFPTVQLQSILGPTARAANTELQAQWRANLGIESTYEMVPSNVMTEALCTQRPHLAQHGWIADYPDPDNFLRVAVSHWQQFTRWHHERYEELVQRARRQREPSERLAVYAQADRILVEEAALLPLAYTRTNMLVKPWVRNYVESPTGRVFWKDVVIEPH